MKRKRKKRRPHLRPCSFVLFLQRHPKASEDRESSIEEGEDGKEEDEVCSLEDLG